MAFLDSVLFLQGTQNNSRAQRNRNKSIYLASIRDGYKLDSESYKWISSVHNSMVGHFGVEKTYEHCKERWGVGITCERTSSSL